jgi:hypothetical protein
MRLKQWKADTEPEWHEDQQKYALEYAELLTRLMREYDFPQIMLEQRLNTGVPGCWGTGDAVIVSPDTIHVVDYKYGQGVPVDAEENPQLMLYGVGALETFGLLGDIQTVRVTVHQPRLESVSTYEISAEDLRKWRQNTVKPMAELALSGEGYLKPSEKACRWCPVAGECRTRADYVTKRDFGHPELLTPGELSTLLAQLQDIRSWCTDVSEVAIRKAYYEGIEIPGWKVVRSGGKRVITDPEQAIEMLADAGFNKALTTKRSTRTLAELDKLVGGKDKLEQVLGEAMSKQPGKEALVSSEDPRPPIDALAQAQKDFSPSGRDESEVK